MNRREFVKAFGMATVGAPWGVSLIADDLWAKLPARIKISGLTTRIVEDEVYLKILTDQGVVGEGHAAVHRKARTCQAAINDLTDVLVGKDPTRIEFLWQAMYRWPRWRGGPVLNAAISGVDLALWDILGKLLDVPVYRLIGGAARDKVRLYIHGSGKEGVQRAKRLGYTAIKTSPQVTDTIDGRRVIKRPWNLQRAVKIIEEMRIEAGDELDIMVDAHGLLTPVMALEFAKAIEPFRVMFLE